MTVITELIAGLLFGTGLMISGMDNPAKVQGFLDLAGKWDPSLAFVMAGAIIISALAFAFAKRRRYSLLGLPFIFPSNTAVTPKLVLGSALFGIGWGLAGLCPGPALATLGTGYPKIIGFVVSMIAGMRIFEIVERMKLGSRYGSTTLTESDFPAQVPTQRK